MHAAVVELYALPDSVRPAAYYHYFFLVRRHYFALGSIRGIVVRSDRLKFGGACIDKPVNGIYAEFAAQLLYVAYLCSANLRYLKIGKTGLFCAAQQVFIEVQQPLVRQFRFDFYYSAKLPQEPYVYACGLVYFIVRHSSEHRVAYVKYALRRRPYKPLADFLYARALPSAELSAAAESAAAYFKGSKGFLEGLLKCPADCHGLSHALH